MICISIGNKSQLALLEGQQYDIIELRLDLIRLEPPELFHDLPDNKRVIATCRPGVYPDQERVILLKECISLGASYVDLELESEDAYMKEVSSYAADYGCEVIISYHNFEITPSLEELKKILSRCYTMGGDLAKIATSVSSRQEIVSLLALYQEKGRKVVIGMGDQGRITRIMAPYLGAEFTFASISGENITAPGQLTVIRLNEIYNLIDES